MGEGLSQDEASQSQQTREEPSYARQQYNEGTSTEAKHSDAKAKRVAEVKLPHNCEAILRYADSPIDRSSVEELYDQLSNGVFLNQKRQKYWVEKKGNSNCFMLFARDLLITWGEDTRYWYWPSVYDQTSYVYVDAAELLNVCWLEIYGKFYTKMLSPGILYEVLFVIKLKDPAYGWSIPVKISLVFPNGHKQERKEKLQTKPREQWIEVPVGEFITSPENVGDIQIELLGSEGVE